MLARTGGMVLLALLTVLVCGHPLVAAEPPTPDSAVDPRRPKDEKALQFWLENMIWHHRFSMAEMRAATGLTEAEIVAAQKKFQISSETKRRRVSGARLTVLPYPGGRHPRIGFRDGALNPQRETKASIFTPWDDASYVVADVPEAIWSNLGLTYLAHTHVPTIWTKHNIELEKLEWQRRDDGTLFFERKLPNGIAFSTKVVPDRSAVWFEMSLTNGTKATLTDLRVQNCVMLAYAKGFDEQTNDNKVLAATKTPGSPYVAVHNADRSRWIISAWSPIHRPWANPPCPCMHSDPKFPDCHPGQTRYVRGLVTFFEGSDIEAKFKELDAIGWRDEVPPQSADARQRRMERIAQRRAGLQIICHRGASEFAHENTLEAYRATFELGADGNEIDIRETKDGVLVCFHDDMLDQILAAYGDVADYTWNELRRLRFRRPAPFGDYTRIPTLAQVLSLHREHAGLLHLDIKRPGLDHKIAQLLDQFDMWEHVMSAPADIGAAIAKDPRYHPLKYKTQLFSDDRDVDAAEIEKGKRLDGSALIVDDPRGCIIDCGRTIGSLSSKAVLPAPQHLVEFESAKPRWPTVLAVDRSFGHAPRREQFADDATDDYRVANLLVRRAQLFERYAVSGDPKIKDLVNYIAEDISERLPLRDWRYHGIDAAAAFRAMAAQRAANAVDVGRQCLWSDDPALDQVRDPKYNNPRSWHDWRIKNIVFPLLETLPGEKTEKVCRDYLALSDDEAHKIGPPQFAAAAKTLLTISPNEKTALELLNDKRPAVRNRAIKVCLQNSNGAWAIAGLKQASPYALAYIPSVRTAEK